MATDRRFEGTLAEEYELITLAYPDFREFQMGLCDAIRRLAPEASTLLEIGTGNGFTTELIVDEFPGLAVTTIDNDPQMVRQARERFGAVSGPADASDRAAVTIEEADALAFLQDLPAGSQRIVASAFTLHNMERTYRERVEREIHRVLADGGLFVNADKYAPEGQERFDALGFQVERFFDAFVPMGKLDLLRTWVVHNIADQSPRFAMMETESVDRLRRMGFREVTVSGRRRMQAVLAAVR